MKDRIFTRGNVEVQNIRVGDIHYEYEWGVFCKVEVLTKPEKTEADMWEWQAKNLKTNKTINYAVKEGHSVYAPKLYDYEAYAGCRQI